MSSNSIPTELSDPSLKRLKRIFVGGVLLCAVIVLHLLFISKTISSLYARATLLPMLLWALVVTTYAFHAERERSRLAQELQIAADIQLGLLPEKALETQMFEVGGMCHPAERVGGDFFDYWLHNSRVCMVVADVTGHDLASALLAASFRSVVRAESAHRTSVSEIAEGINRVMYDDLVKSDLQITFCFGQLDPDEKTFTYCSCGHPYPIKVGEDQVSWLKTGGLLLGVQREAKYPEETVELMPGDKVLMYTDGVIEATNRDETAFGAEGLRSAVRSAASHSAPELSQEIVREVREYSQRSKLRDDVTVLAAQIKPSDLSRQAI
ncbi:MAG: PP2C family protein-serine/threonine phosphatase [Candidatus Brocadiia bacterium]